MEEVTQIQVAAEMGYEAFAKAILQDDHFGVRDKSSRWVIGVDIYPDIGMANKTDGSPLIDLRWTPGKSSEYILGLPVEWSDEKGHLGKAFLVLGRALIRGV